MEESYTTVRWIPAERHGLCIWPLVVLDRNKVESGYRTGHKAGVDVRRQQLNQVILEEEFC
jgi:hypothetical protein